MEILSEFIEEVQYGFMKDACFVFGEEPIPLFKVGECVYISDSLLSKYRNSNALDEHVEKERRVQTFFENANRAGVVTRFDVKEIRRIQGKRVIRTVRVTVAFPGKMSSVVCSPNLLRRCC